MRPLATFLCELLEANDVEFVFGIPGVHTVELYRGLGGTRLRHVTPRHEQGAGFMADGYARVSGRPGVCFVITGPGLGNIATAVGQAYADSVPMLVISTVNAVGEIGSGRGHLHELPHQRQLLAQLTAFSRTILAPTDLRPALAEAFSVFAAGRPRPVHIEIPIDLLTVDTEDLGPARRFVLPGQPAPSPDAIMRAAALCRSAVKPLIITGGGATRAAASVQRLAEALDAPVLMTANGRGIMPPHHPLGVSLAAGSVGAVSLMTSSDLILALGTELGPTDFEAVLDGPGAPSAPVIRVDIDPLQIQRGLAPAVAILADAGLATDALAAQIARGARDGAKRAAETRDNAMAGNDARQVRTLGMMEAVRDIVPHALLVGDSTQPVYAGLQGFAAASPNSFFSSATGFGTLGYGLPAAIGAALAAPARRVFGIVGDGGLQFSLGELGSATELGMPLTLIVWNNRGYGEIKSFMQRANIEPLGVDILTPQFSALAHAYGWSYRLVRSPQAFADALEQPPAVPLMIEIEQDAFLSSVDGA